MSRPPTTAEQITAFRRFAAELERRTRDITNDDARFAAVLREVRDAAPSVRALSPRDMVMLWLQARERGFALSDIDTRDGWRRDRGRQVRDGQAPLYRARPRDTPPAAEHDGGDRRCDLVPTFDVHQTEPLDSPVPHTVNPPHPARAGQPATAGEAGAAGLMGALTAHARTAGYRIERAGTLCRGDFGTGVVQVPASLTDDAALAALAAILPALRPRADQPVISGEDPARSGPDQRRGTSAAVDDVDCSEADGSADVADGGVPCRADGCGGDPGNGEGWGGWCGRCAAQIDATDPTAFEPPAPTGIAERVGLRSSPVESLIAQVEQLAPEARRRLRSSLAAVDKGMRQAAQREAMRAVLDTERDDAYRLAVASPAGWAAVALLVRDQLHADHYRVLTAPYADALNHPAHPDGHRRPDVRT